MKKKTKGTISATEAALKYIKKIHGCLGKGSQYNEICAMKVLSMRDRTIKKLKVKYAKVGKEKAKRLDRKTKERISNEASEFLNKEHRKILNAVSFGMNGNGITTCGTMRSFIEYMCMIISDSLELRERLGLKELDVKFVKKTACTGLVELSFPNASEIEAAALCRILKGNSYDWRRCRGEYKDYKTEFNVTQDGKNVLFKYENA